MHQRSDRRSDARSGEPQIFRVGMSAARQSERRAILSVEMLADQLLERSRWCLN